MIHKIVTMVQNIEKIDKIIDAQFLIRAAIWVYSNTEFNELMYKLGGTFWKESHLCAKKCCAKYKNY